MMIRTTLALSFLVFLSLSCSSSEKKLADASADLDVADVGSVGDAMDVFDDESSMDTTDVSDLKADADLGAEVQELSLEPTEAFFERKAQYLAECSTHAGIYAQSCHVLEDTGDYNEPELDAAFAKLNAREDTADFRAAGLVRMLYLDQKTNALPDELRQEIETTLLDFKYWLSEPGKDKMCYWTENHQILFHSSELLVGQLFKEESFSNSEMTGTEHIDHARPLIITWLNRRARFGFSEWHSNVYFNEDMPALLNLADFAEDEEIRTKAAMVLDIMAYDMLNNTYKGYFATAHGRTYENKLLDGLSDSTREALWIMTGLGEHKDSGHFTGSFMATSGYETPEILENIAVATAARHEHRQRDSVDVAEGADLGISYTAHEDVVFWAGAAALAAPLVINGTLDLVATYDLWDGFLFGDLPEDIKGLVVPLAGTPQLVQLAEELEVLSRGIALESMNTYTWRTPHYQLSAAQDYNPGLWGTQTHIWQATLDGECYVFATLPSDASMSGMGLEFATPWVGSWLPRATVYQNVGVFQYRTQELGMLSDYLEAKNAHAFFPKDRFDEVREENGWVFGKKGDGYVALYSQIPTSWAEENDVELLAEGSENTWVLEMGSPEEYQDFDDFVAKISAAEISFDSNVRYVSPSVGEVTVGWEGPMTVAGNPVELGPYSRWENAYSLVDYGEWTTRISSDFQVLELDFANGRRRLLPSVSP